MIKLIDQKTGGAIVVGDLETWKRISTTKPSSGVRVNALDGDCGQKDYIYKGLELFIREDDPFYKFVPTEIVKPVVQAFMLKDKDELLDFVVIKWKEPFEIDHYKAKFLRKGQTIEIVPISNLDYCNFAMRTKETKQTKKGGKKK